MAMADIMVEQFVYLAKSGSHIFVEVAICDGVKAGAQICSVSF